MKYYSYDFLHSADEQRLRTLKVICQIICQMNVILMVVLRRTPLMKKQHMEKEIIVSNADANINSE